jgi:hypothetical protein
MMRLTDIKSLSDWPKRRDEIESSVSAILGDLPPERAELQVKVLDEMQFKGYVRRRVNYFVEEWERVSAWLFVPDGHEEAPGILCCHGGVSQGKDEPAGIQGEPTLAFAQHFAELGYVTLAPDCITAGERVSMGLQPYDTSSFYKDQPNMSAMGKMLWDYVHAIDVLCEIRRVDSARLGVVGSGFGAYNAIFLVAFDERVQACVASGTFTRFVEDSEQAPWAPHPGFLPLPKLKNASKKGRIPFDWEHVLALGAPSPMLIIETPDEGTAGSRGSNRVTLAVQHVYKLLGAPEAITGCFQPAMERMPPEALRKADEWFEQWL